MEKYLKEFILLHKKEYAISILFSILSAICTVLPYIVAASIIQLILSGNKNIGDYGKYLFYLAIFMTLSNLFHKISTTASHVATFQLLATIRKRLAEKLSKIPLGVIDDYSSGALKDIMVEKIDKMEITFSHVIPEVSGNVLASIFTLLYLFYLNWKLALVAILMIPLSILVYMFNMKGYQERFENYLEKNAILNNTIVEYINGIEVIKAFNQSGKQYERLSKAVYDAAHSAIDWMRENIIGFSIAFSLLPSTIIGTLPIGAYMYIKGSLDLESFIIILLINFGLITPILNAAAHMDNIATAKPILETVAKILDEKDLERPDQLLKEIKHYNITMKDVSFGYHDSLVLDHVNLEIKENTVNALVGPSGSGKSTITKLLASFYEVDQGEIFIGGVNIKEIPLKKLNDMIAYVSQKDYLFNLSIMENLRMGKPGISDDEIIRICKSCGLHDFIKELEQGYDTIVGSKGGSLSGGERQRICIARAMIKDAPIIIFDEATAYTDPENEYVIQSSISQLIQSKTLIVVAHRLSTITNSDQILLINDKKVEATGTHSELLEKSPLYASMYKAHMETKDRKVEYV
ncbi:MAG: ABC transporter ATP-binding protein [Tissierellia bacterium]|nr:ABC transporter ATP-binding protein [Tissierellia bacterium]